MKNLKDLNDFISEKKVTYKRKYTEQYPAKVISTNARVREVVLNAIADGILTEEELDKILSEIQAHKAWKKRNSNLFIVSEEDGIKRYSLSKHGHKIRNLTSPINENAYDMKHLKKLD